MQIETQKNIPFFLLVGQSNIAGRGFISEIGENNNLQVENVFRMNHQGEYVRADLMLQDLDDRFFPRKDNNEFVGPGLFFAEHIKKSFLKDHFGLVLCARGGCGLGTWLDKRNGLYLETIRRAKKAQHYGPCLGILIYIGEADTKTQQDAQQWPDRFETFIGDIKSDLDLDHVPIVFAQLASIGDHMRQSVPHGYKYWEEVQALQERYIANNVEMIRTDDLALNPDGLHVSAKGQIEIGKRYAEVMSRSLSKNRP